MMEEKVRSAKSALLTNLITLCYSFQESREESHLAVEGVVLRLQDLRQDAECEGG